MYIDASALVAVLSGEPEAERVAGAIAAAPDAVTSPIAVLETVLALARPDKFDRPIAEVEAVVLDFLDSRGIAMSDMPPAREMASLAVSAAHRFRAGRRGLNLGDCLHYACARYHRLAILATDGEFRQTDLETVD
jgi:ribonuclease VapC